jgi:metal-sulfur cluster biosynthetic enzyme
MSPAILDSVVLAALSEVIDPELGLDIVSLGLVYGIEDDADSITVTYTLTSPGCPLGDEIAARIVEEVSSVARGTRVEPRLVFSPPWTLDRISEDARFALGY